MAITLMQKEYRELWAETRQNNPQQLETELFYEIANFKSSTTVNVPALNIFNPNYNIPEPELVPNFSGYLPTQSYGFYLQDHSHYLVNI